jgi:hypothetical protein
MFGHVEVLDRKLIPAEESHDRQSAADFFSPYKSKMPDQTL